MSKKGLDISYDEAKEKIEKTLQQLQDPELKIDDMSKMVDEAVELIQYCENSLLKTKQKIDDAIGEE